MMSRGSTPHDKSRVAEERLNECQPFHGTACPISVLNSANAGIITRRARFAKLRVWRGAHQQTCIHQGHPFTDGAGKDQEADGGRTHHQPRIDQRLKNRRNLPRLSSSQARVATTSIRAMITVSRYVALTRNQLGKRATAASGSIRRRAPYIALQIPSHTKTRTPRRRRIAAIPQAANPRNKKTVPEMISMIWPRRVASA